MIRPGKVTCDIVGAWLSVLETVFSIDIVKYHQPAVVVQLTQPLQNAFYHFLDIHTLAYSVRLWYLSRRNARGRVRNALLYTIFRATIQPEDRAVSVVIPPCKFRRQLGFAHATEPAQHEYLTSTVSSSGKEGLAQFSQVRKLIEDRNAAQAKRDVILLQVCASDTLATTTQGFDDY